MKFIIKMVGVLACAALMLNFGVPIIEKTGAALAGSFTSITMQALDDVSIDGSTDVSVQKLANDYGDMTLNDLVNTVKAFASSDMTADEVYEYYCKH